jgi:hypothetical protein
MVGGEGLMRYAILFFGQGLTFIIAVINIRAAARGLIKTTMATDFVFCVVNFLLIQKVATAGTAFEMLAYALGGSSGAGLAILLTRRWDAEARAKGR